jgi:hypothetical protein
MRILVSTTFPTRRGAESAGKAGRVKLASAVGIKFLFKGEKINACQILILIRDYYPLF